MLSNCVHYIRTYTFVFQFEKQNAVRVAYWLRMVTFPYSVDYATYLLGTVLY